MLEKRRGADGARLVDVGDCVTHYRAEITPAAADHASVTDLRVTFASGVLLPLCSICFHFPQ
jgi:hypothetical protein